MTKTKNDELLPWFVQHMRSLGEENTADDTESPCATNSINPSALSEDKTADQESLDSIAQ